MPISTLSNQLSFRAAKSTDKKMILSWFHEEHVRKFYFGDGLKNTLHNLDLWCQGINHNDEYTFFHWLAIHDATDTPFAFLMTSPIDGPCDSSHDYNRWYCEGKTTFSLDLLIGPKRFLGKGLASTMIEQFILSQYKDADYFIIDPEVENPKAIHVYQKVGFKEVARFCPDYNPKPHIMMRLCVSDLEQTYTPF